jgi:riboflavin biosynthesis pyrimidine reductase
MAELLRQGLLDELFLTLSPQLAGRAQHQPRLAMVEGFVFTPARVPRARLLSVKQDGNHLFTRYRMDKR